MRMGTGATSVLPIPHLPAGTPLRFSAVQNVQRSVGGDMTLSILSSEKHNDPAAAVANADNSMPATGLYSPAAAFAAAAAEGMSAR